MSFICSPVSMFNCSFMLLHTECKSKVSSYIPLFDRHDAKKRCKSFDLFSNSNEISIGIEKKHPRFHVHMHFISYI